jgi:GntR family transcriptional regulator / MocR family aminotransferase
VPVDEGGLVVEALPRRGRLVHVTPTHQYPLGVTLSLPRRLALLGWARRGGALVVEDDYDGELPLEGRRIESLQGLDGGRCVAYAGTFSKSLFPSLRLGYVVLPPRLVEPFARARFLHDRQPAYPQAAALARFFVEGDFERHVHRLRRLYRDRRDALRRELGRQLGDVVRVGPCNAGAHLAAHLPAGADDVAIAARATAAGARVTALSPMYRRAPGQPGLVLGFGGTAAADIPPGVAVVADAVRRHLA